MSGRSKSGQKTKQKMRTIGRWYIGETLGKGGYSWVKKGFDKKTGKCVALKFMAKADESWAKEQVHRYTYITIAYSQYINIYIYI